MFTLAKGKVVYKASTRTMFSINLRREENSKDIEMIVFVNQRSVN